MVLSASITAIGVVKPDGAEYLEHVAYAPPRYAPPRRWRRRVLVGRVPLQIGSPVITHLFLVEPAAQAIRFAALLGITDVWDFNQHRIDPRRTDFVGLRAMSDGLEFPDSHLGYVHEFEVLRDLDFAFYFRPFHWLTREILERRFACRRPWRSGRLDEILALASLDP